MQMNYKDGCIHTYVIDVILIICCLELHVVISKVMVCTNFEYTQKIYIQKNLVSHLSY